jgi:hypothetical protein
MSNSVKERITADLQRAKAEGGVRAERIREIVQAAVSQAVAELKAGTIEIRTIAKDAIAAVTETLGETGKTATDEITASVEGVVDGISQSKREAIAETQTQIQQLEAKVAEQEQLLESDVDGALTVIEDEANHSSHSQFKTLIDAAVNAIKDREEFDVLRRQHAKLKAQLAILDANLAARYGERYDEVKQHLDNAKVWYDHAKENVEASGTDPVQKKQAEFETKLGEAGTALAQKERQVKQRLKELWQTATKL